MKELYKRCEACGLSKHYSHFSVVSHTGNLYAKCKKCRALEEGQRCWPTMCVKCKKYTKIYLNDRCRQCTDVVRCKVCDQIKPKSEFKLLTCCEPCAILRRKRSMSKYGEKLQEQLEDLRSKILNRK